MITCDMILEAQTYIINQWEDDGKKVIEAIYHVNPFNGGMKEFLTHCTACGGNWGGMLLTGIKKLYPDVWEAIPKDMGIFAFTCIAYTLLLCGVDTSEG